MNDYQREVIAELAGKTRYMEAIKALTDWLQSESIEKILVTKEDEREKGRHTGIGEIIKYIESMPNEVRASKNIRSGQ